MTAAVTSSEELDDLFSTFSSAGIEVVDSEQTYREEKLIDRRSEGAEEPELDLTPGALDKTNDPVRMYLREMGTVPLLTREGEVAIAKRIERGKLAVIKSISRTPTVAMRIIQMGEALRAGERTVRELVIFTDEEITEERIEERASGDVEVHAVRAGPDRDGIEVRDGRRRDDGPGARRPEGRDGPPLVARRDARLLLVGEREARDAEAASECGPVDLPAAGHEDEDVVVGTASHDDRSEEVPEGDALERRALLGARRTLRRDDARVEARGARGCEAGRVHRHGSAASQSATGATPSRRRN